MTSIPADFTPPVAPSASTPTGTAGAATPPVLPFTFNGSGGEYFRIWIINLLLSIITLGIYSAWAKVRRLKYVYNHTQVNGSSFEYHGKPLAILKGRIIAFILFGGYNLAFHFSPLIGMAAFAILIVVMPWLLWNSFRFRAHNSSYCGIRFGFHGKLSGSYKTFLGIPFLLTIAFWIVNIVIALAVIVAIMGTQVLDDFKPPWLSAPDVSAVNNTAATDQTAAENSEESEEDVSDMTEEEMLDELLTSEEASEEETFECAPLPDTDTATPDTPEKKRAVITLLITLPALIIVMAGLFYAALHYYMKRYQHGNSHFGTASFGFYARMGAFVKAYFLTFLIAALCFAGIMGVIYLIMMVRWSDFESLHSTVLISLIPIAIYLLAFTIIWPIWVALLQNVIWNNTRLEQHQFACRVPVMKMLWVNLSNIIAVILTLGLFFPFAHIRSLKVRISALSLIPAGELDTFISSAQPEVGAIGEGATDFFDFDIGL